MYNQYESSIQNPDIKEAVYQNRIGLERSIRNTRRWLIGFIAFFAIVSIAFGVQLYRVSQPVATEQPVSKEVETEPVEEEVVEVEEEVFSETLSPLTTSPDVLSADEIKQLLVDNFYHKLSFDYLHIEKKNRSGFISGRTSCDEIGFLYTYEHENGYMPDMERGVWVTVTGCGTAGSDAEKEFGDFALMYMPYEALERVYTFQDYIVAIENYAVLYQINQPALAQLLEVDLDSLPPNQTLPVHPHMDN